MRIPEIIAHRGTPRECLENTIASFDRAIEQGADAIELDVHASADGSIVVHHDPDVDTVDVVTGERHRRPISGFTWDALRQVPLADGIAMPTLDEVLGRVGDRVTVYVEVKASGIEADLVRCLDRHHASKTAVHAFDHRIPVSVRGLRPATPIGLLSTSYPVSLAGFVSAARAQSLWQQAHLIDEQLVRDAHALGLRVVAWTVNDAAHARTLTEWGVDALCTDTPGLLRSALRR